MLLLNPRGENTSYVYDAAGQTSSKRQGNGARTSFTYNDAGRTRSVHNLSSLDVTLSKFDYGYDNAGNRTAVVEASGDRVTWTYDATYQLTREQRDGANSFDTSYTYDAAGNRLVEINGAARVTSTYDAANQLVTASDFAGVTTYTHDADGNRTQKDAPAGVTDYAWDEDNRMLEAATPSAVATFTYNADGQRIERRSGGDTKKFIYDFKKLLQETDAADTTSALYTQSLRDEYGEVESQDRSGTSSYYTHDGLGSTDALLSDAEAETDTYTYKAFGEVNAETGATPNPFSFASGPRTRCFHQKWGARIDPRSRRISVVLGS